MNLSFLISIYLDKLFEYIVVRLRTRARLDYTMKKQSLVKNEKRKLECLSPKHLKSSYNGCLELTSVGEIFSNTS